MIPRLHRFYGPADAEYGSWWKVPPHILGCYTTMLPRLEAGERLDDMTVALASGNRMLEDHSRQRYVGQLERQLAGKRRPKRATVESLGDMRVQVVIEKDNEGGDDVG